VTHLGWGGVYSKNFIANCLLILTVKEFWKSVNIWRSYEVYKKWCHFLAHPVYSEPYTSTCNKRDSCRSVLQKSSPSYYNSRRVCLFVCLSAPSSAFRVARLPTPTVAFESLGFRYVPATLLPTSPTGSLRGRGLSCRVFFPPPILSRPST